MIKVLMVSSEAVPYAKTGGLGDVIGSLPKALVKLGIDVRVIMPFYKSIPGELRSKIAYKKCINIKLGWRNQYCNINEGECEGIKFYFIDNDFYFGRDSVYGYTDEPERFAFFSKAVLEALPHIDFTPDIIHCHDWQSGMVPALLKTKYHHIEIHNKIRTLFTIHNLQYQGVFSREVLGDILELGDEYFTYDRLEFYGDLSFMKGGLVYSDLLSTVSPTYSWEIQYPYFGERLDGLLRFRRADITGILNGIDYDEYDPLKDTLIFKNYNMNSLRDKEDNKLKLQELLGLEVSKDIPVIGMVSRLVSSKGLDLIECIFDELIETGAQFVVLGTGEDRYESFFQGAGIRYKGKVSANIRFDNTLAHRIYAGADMFLMPSVFEPCGLSQIISLRYGTIPIVHEVGGLKDTIQPFNEFSGGGNGFSFADYNVSDMLYTIKRALDFYKDKKVWEELAKRAMACNFSWDNSASRYVELYNKLIAK